MPIYCALFVQAATGKYGKNGLIRGATPKGQIVRQTILAGVNRSLPKCCGTALLALCCLLATPERQTARAAQPDIVLSSSPAMFELSATPNTVPPAPTAAPISPSAAAAVSQVVFGIISYTRWPVDPPELQLCIVPPSGYADALVQAAGRTQGRPVQVRRVDGPDDPALVTNCDVIYIGAVSDSERARIMARLQGHPALTISEHDDECAVGSVFCLAIRDAQVSFKVNLDSLARSGVRVHPSVLQLAHGKAAR